MTENRPRIPYFKEYIPTSICFVMSMYFAIVFQFCGGVFLPTSVQMSSALGCIKEHIMMAGYASFIGMTLIFPILFRLKFRFTTRRIFLTVCPVLIACNLIAMHTQNVFILVVTCFISGFFRMWGTFECFSNTRLSVTPSGNFSVFYPVIYIVVLESIQLSGLVATHLSDWANWRYMHWFVIGMLTIVWLCVLIFTRPFRIARKKPLYGIDWIGAILWGIILFCIVFVCIYGDYYDWTDSPIIRGCIVTAIVVLLININRMYTCRRPYIEPQVFRYHHFPTILFLFLMLCLFLTTSSVLQELFMSSILQYDSLNAVSLNWFVFIGILTGAGIVFYRQVVLRKGYKLLISVGFILIMAYQYYMYFLIYPTLNIESLYFPNFLKGVGHGILYISLTIYVAKTVPFKHFFQGLCVLSFIRTSISTPLGTAILTRCLKYMQRENLDRQCWKIDEVGEWVPDVPIKQLYAELVQSSLTTSLKELFGVVCIIGTILLIFILNYKLLKKLYISFKRHRLKITAKIN